MEQSPSFLLKNVRIAQNFRQYSTDLSWENKKFCQKTVQIEHVMDAHHLYASAGALMIVDCDAYLEPLRLAALSPILLQQGVTSTLVMLDHLPSTEMLAGYGRALKNHIAVHVGWLLPLGANLSVEAIQKLEQAPAVAGWYVTDDFIRKGEYSNLGAVSMPLYIHAPNINATQYDGFEQVILAMKKNAYVSAYNSKEYIPSLCYLGLEISENRHILPCIVTASPNKVENLWQKWCNLHGQCINAQSLSLMGEYIAQLYISCGVSQKGRLWQNFDADVVLLDDSGHVHHVIIGGEVALWQKEFTMQYAGLAL